MDIISKHLTGHTHIIAPYKKSFDYPIHCAFTGQKITEGYPISWLVSDVFTDYEYMKYPSEYVCEDIALIIKEVIPNGRGKFNALRNYSFYADEKQLRLLKREEILDLLLNIPSSPFTVGVTYSNKKHLSFKCRIQNDPQNFLITTDKGDVRFDRSVVDKILPIMRKWYTIIPEKASTSAQPTYFSKDDILNGNPDYRKVIGYGMELFQEENDRLERYRFTPLFELLVFTLNKKPA